MVQFVSFDALASSTLLLEESRAAAPCGAGFSARRGLVVLVGGLLGYSAGVEGSAPTYCGDWAKGVAVPDWRKEAFEWCKANFNRLFDLRADLDECVPPAMIDVLRDHAAEVDKVGSMARYELSSIFTQYGVRSEEAVGLLTMAAKDGFGPAQHTLGDLYKGGFKGIIPQDESRAFEWHARAAKQGCAVEGFVPESNDADENKVVAEEGSAKPAEDNSYLPALRGAGISHSSKVSSK